MRTRLHVVAFFVFFGCIVISGLAQEPSRTSPGPAAASPSADDTHPSSSAEVAKDREIQERELRLEGEKRFRTNCGRCHQAPHKFPPRVMAAAIRHMRVRAMITDEDMRLILRFMTQ
jgi:mono/diheme cytochrome c family protein